MTIPWEDESTPVAPEPVRRRGLLHVLLGGAGWLLVIPLLHFAWAPTGFGSYLSLPVWAAGFLLGAAVSVVAVLLAGARRSWWVALACVLLAVVGAGVFARLNPPVRTVEQLYREHRTALARLAGDYRDGRLPVGMLKLPADLRSLCPSGFAYAGGTGVFVQVWQNFRAESGTGLAYLAEPSTPSTPMVTAEGDQGSPQRLIGGGWWWVA